MEQRNNNQNSVIFQVEKILNKMSNQVNFLIRKDKLMNQLDVDVLMENTRKLYDTLCSVKCNMDTDSIPMEIVEETPEILEPENLRTLETENLEETSEEELSILESQHLSNSEETLDDLDKIYEEFEDENSEDIEEDEEEYFEEASETENLKISETENLEETSEEEHSNSESQHLSISEEKEDSGIRAYRKEHQTLGDMLELLEDNSLAARLQKKPVTDLMTAIGINDKFLLLNELFTGSMEKYNRSIRALNNFPTLLGAKTYMSELQIEFQWDVNSEAYRKLNDLVERRFTPIHNS